MAGFQCIKWEILPPFRAIIKTVTFLNNCRRNMLQILAARAGDASQKCGVGARARSVPRSSARRAAPDCPTI
jgi:hypothetical protein